MRVGSEIPKVLKAAVVNSTNFSYREVSPGVYEPIEGPEYEILEAFAQALNFRYKIVVPNDKIWGMKYENGSWGGIMAMLQRKTADIATDYMIVSEERAEVADFSFPYESQDIAFAMEKSGYAPKEFAFTEPFSTWVWAFFFISAVICASTLLLIKKTANKFKKPSAPWYQTLLNYVEKLFTGEFTGMSSAMKSMKTKLVLSFWFLGYLILILIYKGILLSLTTVPVKMPQIETTLQLREAVTNEKVKLLLYTPTPAFSTIMKTEDKTLEIFQQSILKHPGSLVDFAPYANSDYLILSKTVNNRAVFMYRSYLASIMHRYKFEDRLYISKDGVNTKYVAAAFRKDFCCIRDFNKVILKLIESGLIGKWYQDRFYNLRPKSVKQDTEQQLRPLTMNDVRGAFWLLLIGYLISFFVFFLEIVKGNKCPRRKFGKKNFVFRCC